MDDLRTQVFRKMGWEYISNPMLKEPDCMSPDGVVFGLSELLPIDSQWEVCAKYLVPFMLGKGYEWSVTRKEFCWITKTPIYDYKSEIKDDNIAKAACEAFMEVSLD